MISYLMKILWNCNHGSKKSMQLHRMSLTVMLAAISVVQVWNFMWVAKAALFGRDMVVSPKNRQVNKFMRS